jgi:hypothetical protein
MQNADTVNSELQSIVQKKLQNEFARFVENLPDDWLKKYKLRKVTVTETSHD